MDDHACLDAGPRHLAMAKSITAHSGEIGRVEMREDSDFAGRHGERLSNAGPPPWHKTVSGP
jgi:hypothetical protein